VAGLLATGLGLEQACAAIAQTNPEGADAALNAWLKTQGAVDPEGLDLFQQGWVTRLPDGLAWGQSFALNLTGTAIVALPRGLDVRYLFLAGCPQWDGEIPPDAKVTSKVFTDRHRMGVALPTWRRQHPQGERPGVAAGPVAPAAPNLTETLAALQATGAPLGEALAVAADGFPLGAVVAHLAQVLASSNEDAALGILEAMADRDPGLARVGLELWGRGRTVDGYLELPECQWVTALPQGLAVTGSLMVSGLQSLTSLPEGLRVGGSLSLDGTAVTFLPDGLDIGGGLYLTGSSLIGLGCGLRVGADLDLTNCRGWNGQIPADTEVAGKVLSDRHEEGIPLDHWRHLHPRGER
jgi:hypothetical protein